jgi:hypothetical protein
MNRYQALDGPVYVARYRWHKRVKDSVVLGSGVVLVVAFVVSSRFSFWVDVGELGMLALLAVCLARTAGPALHRDVAVAIDVPGIVLGGLGFWAAGQELIPWSQVARVRLYEYHWTDTTSEGPITIHYYPTVHIDRRDGQVTRTDITGARLDPGRLCEAVAAFDGQVPVSVEGHVGTDSLAPPTGCVPCSPRCSISRTGSGPSAVARACRDPRPDRQPPAQRPGPTVADQDHAS